MIGLSMAESVRERCLLEALKIISEQGLDGLSLREVARNLGVSHQAPYKHFASREHLLAVAAGRAYQALGEAIASRPVRSHPAQNLEEIGLAYLRFARENPVLYRLLFAMSREELGAYPDAKASYLVAYEELAHAIQRMIPGADPGYIDSASHFAWATVHGLASLSPYQSDSDAACLSFICRAIESGALEQTGSIGNGGVGGDQDDGGFLVREPRDQAL